MPLPERTRTPQGLVERGMRFVFAALVVGGPLAWFFARSWGSTAVLLATCGLLGA